MICNVPCFSQSCYPVTEFYLENIFIIINRTIGNFLYFMLCRLKIRLSKIKWQCKFTPGEYLKKKNVFTLLIKSVWRYYMSVCQLQQYKQ